MFGAAAIERLEQQFDTKTTLLDFEGNYGSNENQFVVKLEGKHVDNDGSEYELEILYGRPFSAYFDLQVGLDLIDHGEQSIIGVIAGIEGMAPYRIDVDASIVLTEDGDALLGVELERDFLLSRKFVLRPRAELAAALSDVEEIGIVSGFHKIEIELRGHYEINRKFSPYIGVSWQRILGDSADIVAAAGEDSNIATVVAGISFWF